MQHRVAGQLSLDPTESDRYPASAEAGPYAENAPT
jgi:hypothetical protein